jgi:tetratricopeptide (TPR) repeat protein
LVVLLASAGCASHALEKVRNSYVNPATCETCHFEIAKTYRQTGMGRSFYRPGAQTSIEDFTSHNTLYNKASDRYYQLEVRDGKYYESRYQTGYGNRETNRVEKQIDFVVGSGNHARTYLHRNAEGQLVELPVSWYSENGGYWAMSPGYDNARQEDFRRPAPDDCLFCHNGYPRSAVVAEGIDCQRCHGPGGAHVEAAGSGKAKTEAIRASIVNPARLDRDRQLDDCMQCHLETTSLRLPNAIRRYDRTPFSYRPGESLTDYELFFDHAPGAGFDQMFNDRFEVAHQAYRLRKSACFAESRMTCTTCHDPHRALRGPQAIEHYVGVCRSCHAAVHAAGMPAGMPAGGSNCLDCHMWKRRADDAVHLVMTDHFIQRRKPARDLLAPLQEKPVSYQGEVVPYYYPAPAQNDLYLAVAQVQHESNLRAGIPRLEQAIAKSKPDDPEFYLELGKAWSKSGDQTEAIRWFEEALRRRDGFHPALRELAAALALSGNLARAVEVGERAGAQQPPDTVALTNLGNAYLRQGNAGRAKQILEQALASNPDLPDANNLLGLVWLSGQNQAAAEVSFRNAIAIQPDMAEPHNNLGNLLAGRGDYAEAEYHFQKAIANNPSYVDARHSYGLLLALRRSFDQALAELQEAVRLDPNSAQLHIDLADVLAEKQRASAAEDEYRRAIQLNPGLAEAYYGLGNVLAAERKTADAARAFQMAIERNPEYYEAHLALGTIMARAGNLTEARRHFQKAAESRDPAVRQNALNALR